MATLSLPQIWQQTYQQFAHHLRTLDTQLTVADPDLPLLSSEILNLQQFFQTQIETLNFETLDHQTRSHLQLIHTELCKHMRLLKMETLFLQTARQSGTIGQRLEQIKARIHRLLNYCDGVIQESSHQNHPD